MVQRVQADGAIVESSTQQLVEHTIWEEIHGKRFHIAEQAPICSGRLRGEFGYMARSPSAQAVLDGGYDYPQDMHQGTKELLQEARIMCLIIPKDSVSITIEGRLGRANGRRQKSGPLPQPRVRISVITSQVPSPQ